MKLPLLVYTRPSLAVNGPLVCIPEGTWKVESNHKDSSLMITLDDHHFELKDGIEILGDKLAQVLFKFVGTESEISIYAHKQRDLR